MKIQHFLALMCLAAATAAAQNNTSCASLLTPTVPCYNLAPTRQFGPALQVNPPKSASPNLVEGRELFQPYGVAIDTTSTPPVMYVVDAGNNRVLGWKMAGLFGTYAPADIVIGQRDKYSTLPLGPGSGFSSGLNTPVAVAVDAAGNLWVVDGGNNRILRYPKAALQSEGPSADIVIGQASIGTGTSANRGGSVGANTLFFGTGGNSQAAEIAFDPQGNLWTTDYGNNRVVRYPAASLVPNADIAADYVLGQQNFTTNAAPTGTNASVYNKSAVVGPVGLAISAAGAVYVSDSYRRVLYFGNQLQFQGQQAIRLLGVIQRTTTDTVPPAALNGCPASGTPGCEQRLGTTTIPPIGLTVIADSLYVADYGNNRIVKYAPPGQWQPECPYTGAVASCSAGTVLSPIPVAYLGQASGLDTKPERGARIPAADSLFGPLSATGGPNGELWVADGGNNRVVVFPNPTVTGSSADATRVLGQASDKMGSPNLIEGRELYIVGVASGVLLSGTAVVDSQNHLFIADTFNNRILGFSDYRKVKAGVVADMVIGQADVNHGVSNYASNDPTIPSEATLNGPTGLAIDSNGSLWVADTFNGRVLRFPNPFGQTAPVKADLVLGKTAFNIAPQNQSDINRNTLRTPYRLAFASDGSLAVSEFSLNRVMIFRKPSGGDFATGQQADLVVGQTDFVSSGAGNGGGNFTAPRGVAFDSLDRLYVADAGNSRLLVFPRLTDGSLSNGSRALLSKVVSQIHGVAVNKSNEIWVTATNSNQVVRYPQYETLSLAPDTTTPLGTLLAGTPTSISLDPFDNPIVIDGYNRAAFFYTAATFQNSASFANDLSGSALTPGMLALLYRYGSPNFSSGGVTQADTIPVPTMLADIQVTVNGIPSPIYRVFPDRIDFWVPWAAPTTGTAEVVATRVSTGEVLASAIIPMNVAAPAFYTAAQNGNGQISALNYRTDGTYYGVNSTSNPVAVGDYVSIFGTGLGPVSSPPADGALSSATPAPATPTVTVNAKTLGASDIQYFGLAPNLVGLFQLTIRVPQGTPPGAQILVGMIYRDIPSTTGPVIGGKIQILRTTISVK